MSLKYIDEYVQKLTFADEAVRVIKPGDRVIYAFGICSINELDRSLARRKEELHDIQIICNDLSCRYYTMDEDDSGRHFRFNEGICPGVRESAFNEGGSSPKIGNCSGNNSGYIFMATVSPMDKDGYFWFGSNAMENPIFKKYYEIAQYVILEINERILEGVEAGQECIHISQVDLIVGSNNSEIIKGVKKTGKCYPYNKKAEASAKAV